MSPSPRRVARLTATSSEEARPSENGFPREALEELTSFGDGGRQPGQWYGVHSIATDSQGNLYTTETYEGKRVQKFVYKGLGPVTNQNQGVVWPTTSAQ